MITATPRISLELSLIQHLFCVGKRRVVRRPGRENDVVGASPEVAAGEAILGHQLATKGVTMGTAETATPTPTPTAAGLQGEGDGVAAADATQTTNDFAFDHVYRVRHRNGHFFNESAFFVYSHVPTDGCTNHEFTNHDGDSNALCPIRRGLAWCSACLPYNSSSGGTVDRGFCDWHCRSVSDGNNG